MQEEEQKSPKILSETYFLPLQSLELLQLIFVMCWEEATN